MAKILVGISSALIINNKSGIYCFYEQFLNALKESGNQILVFNSYEFHSKFEHGDNKLRSDIDESKLVNNIQRFNPDIVISFNNIMYDRILKIVDCPIIVWNADMFWYWNQEESIRENIDRYIFFCSFEENCNEAKEYFKGIQDKQIFYMPFGTSLQKEEKECNHAISFIGSILPARKAYQYFIATMFYSCEPSFSVVLDIIKKNPRIRLSELEEYENIKDSVAYQFLREYQEPLCFDSWFGDEERILYLDAVSDLGFSFYGTDTSYFRVYLPSLAFTYNPRVVYSVKDTQDIYNSSKLCMNTLHKKGVNMYSWRVHDIMATNGCLVSERSRIIEERFSKYVDIPMFESPEEARELCIKLLKDEAWRKDIVLGSQEAIKDGYEWHTIVEKMQEALGSRVNILPDKESESKGYVQILRARSKRGVHKEEEVAVTC